MRASTELDNLVKTGKLLGWEKANHPKEFNKNGYNRYSVEFVLDNKVFTGEMLVALSVNDSMFYDIVKIKESSPTYNVANHKTSATAYNNTIPQSKSVVNSNSTQKSEKDASSAERSSDINERASKADTRKRLEDRVSGDELLDADVDIKNNKKISAEMTDEERYNVLKNKIIKNVPVAKDVPQSIVDKTPEISSWEDINKYFGSEKRNIIHKIVSEFDIFGKEYTNEDVELSFEFSGNNFRESYNKQGRNYVAFAKMFSAFDKVIESAVGIEVHNRKDYKQDPTLDAVFVLVSAYQDGEYIVPVKLEVKKFKDKQNSLYVAISLDAIKKTEVWKQGTTNNGVAQNSRSVNISISDFFKKINPKDESFYKYIPKQFFEESNINERSSKTKKTDTAADARSSGEKNREAIETKNFEGLSVNDIIKGSGIDPKHIVESIGGDLFSGDFGQSYGDIYGKRATAVRVALEKALNAKTTNESRKMVADHIADFAVKNNILEGVLQSDNFIDNKILQIYYNIY